jgi:hypothetical protein
MTWYAKFISSLLIYGNIALMVYSYFGLTKLYTHPVIDFLISHSLYVFVFSFAVIILLYRGGGVLAFLHSLIRK